MTNIHPRYGDNKITFRRNEEEKTVGQRGGGGGGEHSHRQWECEGETKGRWEKGKSDQSGQDILDCLVVSGHGSWYCSYEILH